MSWLVRDWSSPGSCMTWISWHTRTSLRPKPPSQTTNTGSRSLSTIKAVLGKTSGKNSVRPSTVSGFYFNLLSNSNNIWSENFSREWTDHTLRGFLVQNLVGFNPDTFIHSGNLKSWNKWRTDFQMKNIMINDWNWITNFESFHASPYNYRSCWGFI